MFSITPTLYTWVQGDRSSKSSDVFVLQEPSKNLGHKWWGGAKILGKFIFRQKISSILSKLSDDLFLVIDNFLQNLHLSFKMYSVFFVFLYCCLCFCFLSCLFF